MFDLFLVLGLLTLAQTRISPATKSTASCSVRAAPQTPQRGDALRSPVVMETMLTLQYSNVMFLDVIRVNL